MITQDELKELLHYDKDTGVFTWRTCSNNTISFGDEAGTPDNGYIRIGINKNIYMAHRLAWLYIHGYFPEQDIDHINRVRYDNRICNLREVSRTCNIRNSSIAKNNTSGVTGVIWDKRRLRWRPIITVEHKRIRLGDFVSLIDAVIARWKAEVKYGFPNCNTTSTAFEYLKKRGGITNGLFSHEHLNG